jgi:cyclic-di-GMP-binding biofilm dispersal mediator protein
MKRNLDGKSILLAGATGGLGQQIARHLEKEGAQLLFFGRDPDRLEAFDLHWPHSIGDIADSAACETAIRTAICAHGKLDGVINSAGLVAFGELEDLSDQTIDELLSANLIGPARLMRTALPEIETGGFFANVSAVVAERPVAGMAFYSATKAALTALDQAMAREMRRRRIDILDLRPPHMETGLVNRPIAGVAPILPEGRSPESIAQRMIKAIKSGEREVASQDF